MIADIVYSNQTNLSQEQQKELFVDFFIRMRNNGIQQKSSMFNQCMMSDPYLNALRCVYGYVLTCHKSQGGEWDNVYLDIPRNLPLQPKPYVYQWIYTAMTRARKDLYVVDDFYLM
ncbi:MAG: ATP-binding domain-containing protein [Bacteroidales bacterium]|nr:ATP-binding domain-containing protein [Bacteroidales bacterium]MCM1147756.1 ATP-binding domain-containing protein [Bacteroidales bacterium]MCM1206634.1 ATP-binding domain-containing protein [Bacillota bacterium]MCM1510625.1 ATP-binding domain-containing protein [Clostridium sp.]